MNNLVVRLTIGIPTHNSEKYIEQTLKGLMNQTCQDWVCLVSDDNSSDKTLHVVKRLTQHDERFIFFEHKSQLGPAKNWNYLIEQTNTEFVKILHADDILHPNNLEFSMKLISRYPKSVLVSSKRNFAINPKEITLGLNDKNIKFKIFNKNDVIKKLKFTNSNFIGEPSFVIFKTEYLKKIRGFSDHWKYMIDLDCYVRILDHGDYIKINKILGTFRVSKSSWSNNLSKNQYIELRAYFDTLEFTGISSYAGKVLSYIRFILRNIYYILLKYT